MVSIEIATLLVLMLSSVEGTEVINAVEVNTPSGWVRGYEENYENKQLYRFVKIPFAQPPIGKLRFQKPQPIGEWEGVQGISDVNSPSCPQFDFPIPGFDNLEKDENCLFLNIYVPGKISKERNLSVMVWIHGGGFVFGGASQYKPQKLVVGGDVIVVTINYRLALLGFFTLDDPLLSGNFGLLDQIEALRWVQKNIEAFGGNPNSVTIFGESAGGMSVSLQTLIPSNKGLFQRAISQSGVTSIHIISKKEMEKKTAALLLEKTNCNDKGDVSETLKCLQEIPVENITYAFSMMDFRAALNTSYESGGFIPNVDGELIKENIGYPKSFDDDIYSFFRSIDFMSGTLDGEGSMVYMGITPQMQEHYEFNITEKVPRAVLCEMYAPVFVETAFGNAPELTQEICDFYTDKESIDAQSNKVCEFTGDSVFIVPSNKMLSIHAKNNQEAKTFQYLITKKSPVPFGGDPPAWFKGVGHGDDVYLVFNLKELLPNGSELDDENSLSVDVIKYWTNFAKFGNPNGDKVPQWPSYDDNNKRYVILDTPITTGENLKSEATALINKIIEKGRQQLIHDEL
ncbi:acetylcholinesterase-like [Ostrea edulis]|uniref:acetylcholinesterase-like n=1 Tax=Ostrea edulis TaxID=37623 RepID=UPI0024AF7E16|nr:acetylcholinesterase-like [Ostrea edulis]XP_048755018.2 acetylcholinesterase-like [Ostrea edulis]